ncbi:uracil-DNA glycosylase [Alkalilimnicola ehrlichii MLHE-1]|uniref:Type-5 uracil-DNA glycosylase n=1 Tax=Alkalilimnicola ehrlichii (strain ATCC BAA-1101 / DSM 17681 / MLHE-1) TaxID=187272 RepID=Q0A8X7_ALKEH|nr:uracil-DNA glycosylase [Alkalilimnicola ehrlichii]ABI56710.1 Uracil-DNA glycosylase superfamily [Alkalilimnicola ehrlichii MLHE-1]
MSCIAPFDLHCRRCPRLAAFLDQVAADHPAYHARPVPSFGDPAARLLVVGLAPGMHGANASGRPFTGDHAGILLYRTLHACGFANQPNGDHPEDGLVLHDCRITNAVRCLPPGNKPNRQEVRNCLPYLRYELSSLGPGGVVLALGRVAHEAVLLAEDERLSHHPFAHGAEHPLAGGRILLDSYHCSRYNTQTRRLTPAMFSAVFQHARHLLSRS